MKKRVDIFNHLPFINGMHPRYPGCPSVRTVTLGGTYYYDFHARQLNSATAHWNAPDALAFKYPGISPYTYCAANPILFVDPTGQKIVVTIDGEAYQYRYGSYGYGFYGANNTLYTGNDTFAKRVKADLQTLQEGNYGRYCVRYLEQDKETITIKAAEKNSYIMETNTVNIDIDNKVPILVFNDNGAKVIEIVPSYIVLGHELLGHALDDLAGGLDLSTWYIEGGNIIRTCEKTACHIENAIRYEHNLYYRADYSNDPVANGGRGYLYDHPSKVMWRPGQWLFLFLVIKGKNL